MKSIGIPPLFIYLFHYPFNRYLQTIYFVQGLTLEPWRLQSPQGIYNPEIKAMIISSTKNSHVKTDSDCREEMRNKEKIPHSKSD